MFRLPIVMPNSIENIANLQKWRAALEKTGLAETLRGEGPFTIFAPIDVAFDRIPENLRRISREDADRWKRILAYHIGFGDVRSDDLAQISEVTTMEGSVIAVEKDGAKIKLNDATVITLDILVDNAVIHVIDTVLSPALLLTE